LGSVVQLSPPKGDQQIESGTKAHLSAPDDQAVPTGLLADVMTSLES